jgi:hypothetical protein
MQLLVQVFHFFSVRFGEKIIEKINVHFLFILPLLRAFPFTTIQLASGEFFLSTFFYWIFMSAHYQL